jgi:hypothetical protein
MTLALAGAFVLSGLASPALAAGATQVAGTIDGGPCDTPPAGFESYDYAFPVAGDLDGCVYGVITIGRGHPSGTYQERADEVFVGSYGSHVGTFEMTENFTAKEDPDNTVTGLFFARCKHPIKAGTGTGDFEGVTGRLDFKDDTVAGTTTYTGHLRWG